LKHPEDLLKFRYYYCGLVRNSFADLQTFIGELSSGSYAGTFPCFPVHSPTPLSASSLFLPSCPFCHPHPFPLSITLPIIHLPHSTNPARESGERCKKLPQRVRAEPGCQTHFGAVEANNWALACGAGLTALQNE